MGYIYARGGKLYIAFYGHDGKRRRVSTEMDVGQERQAQILLSEIEARIAAEKAAAIQGMAGPMTLRRYGAKWLSERKARGIITVTDDESRLKNHIYPVLGDALLRALLRALRPQQVREWVQKLRANQKIAPRTVNNIYGTLRALCNDALADELIEKSPCLLKKGDLPKKRDKDATWRANAVFTRDELQQLISHPNLPPDRRVLMALMGLAGLRFGEAAALRWRHLDSAQEPLRSPHYCLLVQHQQARREGHQDRDSPARSGSPGTGQSAGGVEIGGVATHERSRRRQ